MEIFNLYISKLSAFHHKAIERDLPINMFNPILIRLNLNINYTDYQERTIEEKLNLMCSHFYELYNKDSFMSAFFMRSTVLFINDIFSFYRDNVDEFIQASQETFENEEHCDSEEFWLTAWHPMRVLDKEVFLNKLNESEKLWKEETLFLKEVLYNEHYLRPINNDSTYWDYLKVKPTSP